MKDVNKKLMIIHNAYLKYSNEYNFSYIYILIINYKTQNEMISLRIINYFLMLIITKLDFQITKIFIAFLL